MPASQPAVAQADVAQAVPAQPLPTAAGAMRGVVMRVGGDGGGGRGFQLVQLLLWRALQWLQQTLTKLNSHQTTTQSSCCRCICASGFSSSMRNASGTCLLWRRYLSECCEGNHLNDRLLQLLPLKSQCLTHTNPEICTVIHVHNLQDGMLAFTPTFVGFCTACLARPHAHGCMFGMLGKKFCLIISAWVLV